MQDVPMAVQFVFDYFVNKLISCCWISVFVLIGFAAVAILVDRMKKPAMPPEGYAANGVDEELDVQKPLKRKDQND